MGFSLQCRIREQISNGDATAISVIKAQCSHKVLAMKKCLFQNLINLIKDGEGRKKASECFETKLPPKSETNKIPMPTSGY
jgi:hypothetical protein